MTDAAPAFRARDDDALAAGLRELGLALPEGAPAALGAYVALLAKWNRTYNLTAIREPERMVTHHLLDALAVLPHLPQRAGLRLLDVGAGGGVPGIVLAIARPQWSVELVDASHKKATFLAQAAAELGLRNVIATATRVEDYTPPAPFDVVISRAFADLRTFAETSARHLAADGLLVAMKGVHPDEEIAELPADIAVIAAPKLDVPGLDAARHLIVMRRAGARA
ncbi:MAG: 16S rRNA (guanine(527)-N(7))-methyltransferase RsmG [Betaproteobacteria bacterium]